MGSRNNKPGRIVKGTALQPTLKSASGVWSLDEAMQAHRANAWPQPDLFQPVGNSLRLDTSRNTTLSKEIPRSGNRQTWTFSAWIKKGGENSFQVLFGTNTATDSWTVVRFQGQSLMLASSTAGNYDCYVSSSSSFRDSTAWYHVVGVADTTNATATNRFRLYANGIRVPIALESTVPLNYNTYVNSSLTHRIGGQVYNGTLGSVFSGNMTEVNFIDGYAVDPSLFGKLDTNNTWVPIPYTGSYGTNGFYLPFTNTTTSQTLGYDASVNGTTIYDADQDPYRGSVALHLTGNGPAGGQNNTFADSGPNNFAITRNGTVTQGSFSPFPMQANAPYNPATHGASAYFSGSTDYLNVASNAAFQFGTGDFTIEMYVYHTNSGSQTTYFGDTPGSSNGIYFYRTSSNTLSVYTTSQVLNSTDTVPANQWVHVALTRSGTTMRGFINGNVVASITNSMNLSDSNCYIGNDGLPSGQFVGYMSNVRVTKGAAIYTAAFTPTNRPLGSLTNNLLTFSEDFANTAFWAQSNVSVTPSFAVAPDGTPSATKLILTSGNSLQKRLNFTSYTPGAGTYTFSVYAKAADYNYLVVTIYESSYKGAVFNLATGVIESTLASTTTSMTSVGNGWYRISVTATTGGTLNNNATGLWPYQTLPGNAGGNATSDGNSSGGVYIWGAQFESASSPSNYVPTPANFSTAPSLLLNFANAAVVDSAGTRNFVTTTNASITASSKYGQGALYFDGSASTFLSTPYSDGFSIGASDYTVEFWCNLSAYGEIVGAFNLTSPYPGWLVNVGNFGTAGKIGFFHANATVSQTVNSTNTVPLNTWTHIAVVKQNNFLKMFINGQLDSSHSLTLTSTGSGQQINIGSDANSLTAPGRRITGSLDDLRITKGVARYTTDFTPPARALPEIGGKSFVTTNVNAGVVRSFTTTGTTAWTAPTDVTNVEVLVVAAGGTGASDGATNVGNGGGGGGGLIYNTAYPVTPGQTYTVTVGAGQVGLSTAQNRSGGNSQFGNLIAIGGGGGGYYSNGAGSTGGSGGGGGAASGAAGAGTSGQGFAGGAGAANSGGGGGGAGGPASGTNSRDGGLGLQFGISGTPTYYAGGGGGSASSGAQGTGGSGSGGAAVSGGAGGVDGTANTGGGGGAQLAGGTKGGNGGSGVVIVRYTTTAVANTSDATSDNLTDSPTLYGHDTGAGGEVVGNYATWSPLDRSPTAVLSNGNLDITPGFSTQTITRATMAVPLGQWYFEVTCRSTAGDASAGEIGFNTAAARAIDGGYTTWAVNSIYYTSTSGNKNIFGTSTAYGATWTANDIIGVAIDTVAGTIVFYKNGVSQGTITDARIISNTLFPVFANNSTTGSRNVSANFGQRAWAYAPPAGFTALTTKNLPRPVVGSAAATPNQYFDTVTYTGTGATQSITGLNFQPDFVWIKNRSTASYGHKLYDVIRGVYNQLETNDTGAETAGASNSFASFNSNGFTLGPYAGTNGSTNNLVAWCWRAGGAAVSNTAGTITSQVSANTASGFSIVTFTGTTSNVSVGHGLGVTPKVFIVKSRSSGNWWYYTTQIDGSLDYLALNTSDASGNASQSLPTSSVFYQNQSNASVAYCFAEVEGFSKFGSYVGNGSADGPFVYTGFRPAFILTKDITSSSYWWEMVDSARAPFNPSDKTLYANVADSEYSGSGYNKDLLSNGFKIRGTSGGHNTSGSTYIYMAFAAKPFGNVNGVAR